MNKAFLVFLCVRFQDLKNQLWTQIEKSCEPVFTFARYVFYEHQKDCFNFHSDFIANVLVVYNTPYRLSHHEPSNHVLLSARPDNERIRTNKLESTFSPGLRFLCLTVISDWIPFWFFVERFWNAIVYICLRGQRREPKEPMPKLAEGFTVWSEVLSSIQFAQR